MATQCDSLSWAAPVAQGSALGREGAGQAEQVEPVHRETMRMAFEQAGGVEYPVRPAQEDSKMFVPLLISGVGGERFEHAV